MIDKLLRVVFIAAAVAVFIGLLGGLLGVQKDIQERRDKATKDAAQQEIENQAVERGYGRITIENGVRVFKWNEPKAEKTNDQPR